MQISKLTQKELDALPLNDKIRKKIKGKYILELNGKTYYGFHSKKSILKALKPQPVEAVYNKY